MVARVGSGWISQFAMQIARGKAVLLHGNIHDQCQYGDGYYTAKQALCRWFQDTGYDIVCTYDLQDHFQFADKQSEQAFSRLAEGQTVNVNNTQQATKIENRGIMRPPERQSGARVAERQPDPLQMIQQLQSALNQSDTAIASIIDYLDLFPPDPYLWLTLRKCILDASVIQRGRALNYRNAVVMLASELGHVPSCLTAENPLLGVVRIPRPEPKERRVFFIQYHGSFQGGGKLSGDELSLRAEEFADLTDGMTLRDLEGISRTSRVSNVTVEDPRSLKRLVDFYKFGTKEDRWAELNSEKVSSAYTQISKRVIGQDAAISAVVDMLVAAQVGISTSKRGSFGGRPRGIFFFVGPTGVGKTELAKALTELVFSDESAFARYDMSEYKEEHSAERLAGAPPGYVGYEAGGILTNRVIEKPFSVLLFDEIEKAHPKVLDKFLQILEDGRLTDGRGQIAYFNETVIIFTSNIGSSDVTIETGVGMVRPGLQTLHDGTDRILSYNEIKRHFMNEVQWFFTQRLGRAELYNRLGDNVVVFDMLRPEYIHGIGRKFMCILGESAEERHGYQLEFDSTIDQWLASVMTEGDNSLYGGRRIKTLIESHVERLLNRWLFEHPCPHGSQIKISMGINGKVDCQVI